MTTNNSQQKNFIASLFDFGFTSFVTLRFLKVIYAIVVVVVLIGGLAFLIAGLATARGASILFVIIFAPLVTLVYLIFARVTFEIIAMFFRIGDNTFLAVQLLRGGNQGGGNQGGGNPGGQWNPAPQPGFGPPPQYGTQAFPSAPQTAPQNYGQSRHEPPTGPTSQSGPTGPSGQSGPSAPTYGAPQGNYGPPAEGPRGQQGPSLEKPGSSGWDPTPPQQ